MQNRHVQEQKRVKWRRAFACWTLMGIVGVALGAVMIEGSTEQLEISNASRTWPAAQALVLKTEILIEKMKDYTNYTPVVAVKFKAKGKDVKSECCVITDCSDPTIARKALSKYRVGQKVEVYYDPKYPSDQTFLVRGAFAQQSMDRLDNSRMLCCGSAVFAILSAAMFLKLRRPVLM